MDDPPDRANHPGRSVHRERFEQPQLPGMEAVQGHADYVDQRFWGNGRWGGDWKPTEVTRGPQIRPYQQPDEQLKMFSSARELMAAYKPLEGDRQEVERNDIDYDNPSSSAQTWREKNTHYYRNPMNRNWAGYQKTEEPIGSERMTDTQGNKAFIRTNAGTMETDEELWERKADEAFDPGGRQGIGWSGRQAMDPHTTMRSHDTSGNTLEPSEQTVTDQTYDSSAAVRGEGGWKTAHRQMHRHPGRPGKFGYQETLGDALEQEGYDWSRHPEDKGGRFKFPVSVQFERESGGEPMILGGHHRLAAMNRINPDTPIPIEYFTDFWQARNSGTYT